MTDRPKRESKKHGQSKAAGALAQLAEIRKGGEETGRSLQAQRGG